jgi:hypothetical protein
VSAAPAAGTRPQGCPELVLYQKGPFLRQTTVVNNNGQHSAEDNAAQGKRQAVQTMETFSVYERADVKSLREL